MATGLGTTSGFPKAPSKAGRFFISSDDDGHRYLVPADKREEWNLWRNIPSEDERSWEVPSFATEIGMAPSNVEFELPRFSDETPVLDVDETRPPFNRELTRHALEEPICLRDGRRWWAAGTSACDENGIITILKKDEGGHYYAESFGPA